MDTRLNGIRMAVLAALTAALAACGLDGAPTAPKEDAIKPGITVSGDARMGVVKGL